MTYFKVKSQFDNYKKGNNDIYIANELYTKSEVEKNQLNTNYMESIEINKNDTYFCFGARFTNKL